MVTEVLTLLIITQLEAFIIEVSMVEALRLRTNPCRVHEVKYFTHMNGTYEIFHTHEGTCICRTWACVITHC